MIKYRQEQYVYTKAILNHNFRLPATTFIFTMNLS